MRELGSWMVTYRDGTTLAQYDESSPHFLGEPGTGEVPFKAIIWPEVLHLRLESQGAVSVFDIEYPEGLQVRLQRRTWQDINAGTMTMAFMVVIWTGGEVTDKSVEHVTYWFPDGTTHQCPYFRCPDAAQYAQDLMLGREHSLMPTTGNHHVETETHLS